MESARISPGAGVGDGGVVVVEEAGDLGAGVGSADAQVEQAAAQLRVEIRHITGCPVPA